MVGLRTLLLYSRRSVLEEVEHSRALVQVKKPLQYSSSEEEPILPASAIFPLQRGVCTSFFPEGFDAKWSLLLRCRLRHFVHILYT